MRHLRRFRRLLKRSLEILAPSEASVRLARMRAWSLDRKHYIIIEIETLDKGYAAWVVPLRDRNAKPEIMFARRHVQVGSTVLVRYRSSAVRNLTIFYGHRLYYTPAAYLVII